MSMQQKKIAKPRTPGATSTESNPWRYMPHSPLTNVFGGVFFGTAHYLFSTRDALESVGYGFFAMLFLNTVDYAISYYRNKKKETS